MKNPEERARNLVEIMAIEKWEEIRLIGEFKAIYRECMEIADHSEYCECGKEIAEKIKKAGNIKGG